MRKFQFSLVSVLVLSALGTHALAEDFTADEKNAVGALTTVFGVAADDALKNNLEKVNTLTTAAYDNFAAGKENAEANTAVDDAVGKLGRLLAVTGEKEVPDYIEEDLVKPAVEELRTSINNTLGAPGDSPAEGTIRHSIKANTDAVNGIRSTLDTMNATVGTLNTEVETINNNINEIHTSLGDKANTDAVDAINNALGAPGDSPAEGTIRHSIKANTEAVDAINTALGTAESPAEGTLRFRLADLESKVAALPAEKANEKIGQLEGRLDKLDGRVNKLETKVERGLAANAALAGLLQPYGVGKFNVSASLGGYRSKTALAVGVGYRPLENLTVRAGVASSLNKGSDVSYNVAAGFEF